MRTLKFRINRQIITQDPTCDFDDMVPGTEGYLKAEFEFSEEWDNLIKVVAFYRSGKECEPKILKDGKSCIIPSEALINRKFSISVIGRSIDKKIKLTTNKIDVVQNGG